MTPGVTAPSSKPYGSNAGTISFLHMFEAAEATSPGACTQKGPAVQVCFILLMFTLWELKYLSTSKLLKTLQKLLRNLRSNPIN